MTNISLKLMFYTLRRKITSILRHIKNENIIAYIDVNTMENINDREFMGQVIVTYNNLRKPESALFFIHPTIKLKIILG